MISVPLAVLSSPGLLLLTLGTIVGLVVLIAKFRCNAFVALILASLAVGLGSGMPLVSAAGHPGVVESLESGVARTLGSLALIIGLGTILGKLLAESGAAEVIANTLVRWLGEKRLDYAVMLIAFTVGISVFFGVGVVLLGPVAFMLARRTGAPILGLALPLAAGLSTAHGLIPPHPGPMVAIATVQADVGKTILWSLVVGLPTALITGPLLARWLVPRVPLEIGGLGAMATSRPTAPRAPGLAVSLFTLLLPVLLMLVATAFDVSGLPRDHAVRQWANLIGSPSVAMLVAVLVAFWTFGGRCGLSGAQILKMSEECVGPAAGILLVIGAGGGFSMVLNASGVGRAIGEIGAAAPVSPLLLGWIIAGLLRVAVGSATVAVMMAAGLMGPILAVRPETNRELLVLALGAGSLLLSHVNDSGFWFVKEYFGMSVPQTLRTWTVVETGIGTVAIVLILALNALL
jgi:GntP family gluconate:H+ symporter